jgi:hypothetical protein
MNAHEVIEDAFLDFLNKYPVLQSEGVPMSLLRLCFFSGYNSAVKTVENLIDEQLTEN